MATDESTTATPTDGRFVPPYGVSWDTFLNAIKKMEGENLPNRIDRSYLSSLSGNVQTYLMAAFRGLGLTEETGEPTEALKNLAADETGRSALMGVLMYTHYGPVVELGRTNATQLELEELWTKSFDQRGETRRKAIRFYLAAAAYAALPVSKMWKAPKAGASGVPRKARAVRKAGDSRRDPNHKSSTTQAGDSYKVTLRSGGSVTLSVTVSLFDLSKNKEDRNFVMGLIDSLTDYGDVETAPVGSDEPSEDAEDTEEDS